jgi:hypothetical protein
VSSNPTSTSTARAGRSPLRSRRSRAGLAGCAVLLAGMPLLAACSAGSDPEVYQIVPDNGQGRAGDMWISNVWVVYDQSSGNAEVIGQVANTSPNASEQLTGVTVGGATATLVEPTDTSQLASGVAISGDAVTIPALKSVQFGQPGQPELEVSGADVTLGSNAQVVYTFANGQSANVTAIVEPNTGQYAQYNPNGPNTASPSAAITSTATAGATGTATPTGTATGTATATATGAAKATGTAKAGTTPSPTGTR